jgi:hypothetical protein
MNNLKQRALDKMLQEMNDEHSLSEDKIHNWLCNQNDEELLAGVLNKDKSIKESLQFCGSKARELAIRGVAMVDDSQVYEWVRYYFITPEINFDKPKMSMDSSVKTKRKTKGKAKNKKQMIEGEQLDLLSFL